MGLQNTIEQFLRPRKGRAPVFAAAALLAVALIGGCEGQFGSRQTSAYKVGEPYQIQGAWYYPAADYGYEEVGVASWYGAKFHGRRTANGEVFDVNKVTAAHRTLPLPSLVEITNLDNGRTLTVRVNDRGPFANDRIIDVSRRGAELLGFLGAGTTKVRVRILEDESRVLAIEAQGKSNPADAVTQVTAAPRGIVASESLAAPTGQAGPVSPAIVPPVASTAPRTQLAPVNKPAPSARRLYVQAGAFMNRNNAIRLQQRLTGVAPVRVIETPLSGRTLYRVRLGPAASREDANRMLARAAQAGVTNARVIADK